MKKKKSRFWLFIWSFLPGAGEMYLGFMKMGLSLMLGFMLLIMVVALTNLGALAVFPVTMYAYCFFHANNLGTLPDTEFYNTEDKYLFGMDSLDSIEKMRDWVSGKYRKIAAAVLIIIGIIMLGQTGFNILCDIFGWDNYYLSKIYYFTRDELPRIVIGIAIIWVGLGLVRGKKVAYTLDEQDISAHQTVEQNDSDNQNNQ